MYNSKYSKPQHQLFEGLEHGDLKKLVKPELHIDEFKSKMGDDSDVIVISFKVREKSPAEDLMSFLERGYDWVLDADSSPGDFEDGDFLVFAELDRDPHAAERIVKLIKDILNLTGQDQAEWKFQYSKDEKLYPLTADAIRRVVPMTSDIYNARYGDENTDQALDAMKEAARVPVKKQAPRNQYTESLRAAAGIK